MVLSPEGAAQWVPGVDRRIVFRTDYGGAFAQTTLHDDDESAEAAGRAWCERGEIIGEVAAIEFPSEEVARAWELLTGERL